MPANRNALIRYKTIDKCLQNKYKKWTLEDLIEECSEVLYDYEGIDKGVSKRTIQGDIQIMRSDKLGYNAPIVVVDRKYYTYEDPDYSITNIPLTNQDLNMLTEAVDVLKQFKGFTYFNDLSGMIQKLEDKVYSEKTKMSPIIDIEKNENLKGLEYIDKIYIAVQKKNVIEIMYQSFKARNPGEIVFHPYLLKEYRNRWFVLGKKSAKQPIMTLALDRIHELNILETEKFIEDKNFCPAEYYKHVIGVTVNPNQKPELITLFVDRSNAPYVITKPLHHSQKMISKSKLGIEITIKVVPNFELEREILGFGENMIVISPIKLKKKIERRINWTKLLYETDLQKNTVRNINLYFTDL